MSQFYYNLNHQHSVNLHPPFSHGVPNQVHQNHDHSVNGGNKTRRAARHSSSQNSNKQHKTLRLQKETAEAAHAATFRKDFDAARSFDIEDDELFCPWHLLTADDVRNLCYCSEHESLKFLLNQLQRQLQSIQSSASDRSSLSSESPDSSPLPRQLQPLQGLSLLPFSQSLFQQGNSSNIGIHQPSAQRARNAIPIVDPNSRATSPPQSISPARQIQKQLVSRRW